MTPNARLSVLLMGLAVLAVSGRRLGTQVLDLIPGWVGDTMSAAAFTLAACGMIFAVVAYRERPLRPHPNTDHGGRDTP